MKNSPSLTKAKTTSTKSKTISFGAKILEMAGIVVLAFALTELAHYAPVNSLFQFESIARQLIFAGAFAVGLLIIIPLIVRGADLRSTKEKLEELESTQSTAYTDDVIKLSQQAVEMPVALPVAWDCLKEATNGLDIKAIDKRRAAWLVDAVDDDRRTVRCSLQYIADPLGRKLSQIYPRTIEMVASVDGHGLNTKLRTRYTFATPMDLEAVSEIISKTNSRLNEIIVEADRSVKEQRGQMRHQSAVAQLEKPMGLNLENLGVIDLPISLN